MWGFNSLVTHKEILLTEYAGMTAQQETATALVSFKLLFLMNPSSTNTYPENFFIYKINTAVSINFSKVSLVS